MTHQRKMPRGVVEQWTSPGAMDITFVRADLEPPVFGTGPPVDVYTGAVWSLTAYRLSGPLKFGAHLTDPEAQLHLDASNGEALEAVTFERAGLRLSIGTHDDEALKVRTEHDGPTRAGPPLPRSCATAGADDHLGRASTAPDQNPRGSRFDCRVSAAGEHVDIHVATAWAVDRDVYEVTWFAVDADPRRILMEPLRPKPCTRREPGWRTPHEAGGTTLFTPRAGRFVSDAGKARRMWPPRVSAG